LRFVSVVRASRRAHGDLCRNQRRCKQHTTKEIEMATKKPTKKTVTAKAKAPATLTGSTAIAFKAQREKTGPKTKLLSLVPKKGSVTLKQLQEKAEAEGIKPARVIRFIKSLEHYGYITTLGV
jgi:hypothetical protein